MGKSNADQRPTAVPAADKLAPGRVLFAWQECVRDSTLPVGAKAVAWALATRMDSNGRGAFPSLKTLAADVSLSRRQVIRYIEHLVAADLLIRERPLRKGPRYHNTYTAAVPSDGVASVTSDAHDTNNGDEMVSPMTNGGDTDGTLTPPTNSTVEKPPITKHKGDGGEEKRPSLPRCPACNETAGWCVCGQTKKIAAAMPWADVA